MLLFYMFLGCLQDATMIHYSNIDDCYLSFVVLCSPQTEGCIVEEGREARYSFELKQVKWLEGKSFFCDLNR